MPYTTTTFNSGAAPGIDAPTLNTMQTQYLEATNSFGPDMFAAGFVYSGFTAAKDGTTASQLDVAAGVAYLLQTDATTRRRSAGALTYSTVGHATATMFLDLNPDGTWSWATTHSAITNYLAICTVTTDASANIATVTDARPLNASMLSSMAGDLTITGDVTIHDNGTAIDLKPPTSARGITLSYRDSGGTVHDAFTISSAGLLSLDTGAITTDGAGNITKIGNITFGAAPLITTLQSGAANSFKVRSWNGTSIFNALAIGQNVSNTHAVSINSDGMLFLGGALANSGVISTMQSGASAVGFTFKTWNATAGVTPFSVGGQFNSALAWVDNSGNVNAVGLFGMLATATASVGVTFKDQSGFVEFDAAAPAATARGIVFAGYDGTSLHQGIAIASTGIVTLGMSRNGAVSNAIIYTGSTTPTTPPTGSIWFNV